ncbi:MAG: hypothetical protein JNK79_05385 [Chitinophagaceae bacterium]|nr:hypothetical protein [Chitinophagaceae bacterium]
MKVIPCFILVVIIFSACKKENTGYDTRFRGTVTLEFDNVAGGEDIRLNTGNYVNAAGETYSVRSLRYFVSNIVLVNTNGTEYVVPQDSSYFLVDESIRTSQPSLQVPEGEYSVLKFILGIDSLRSTMDLSKRTGVLAPTVSTYLDENSGYVFFSLEGNSPQAPENRYQFHIAGYGGKTSPTINNIKNISIDLTQGGIVKVREGHESVIHIFADISRVFTGTADISLAQNNIIQFEPFSVNIANNYALMFRHDHTHNE